MSKMDDLRAMREAKYARNAKAASATPARAKNPVAPVASKPAKAPVAAEPEGAEALCGHSSISGRTCTREKGHSAKSHRYS